MPKKYSPELRERAIRMVLERQATQGGPRSHSIRAVAPQLDVSEETLRMWCQRHGHEVAQAPASETPAEEIRRLKRELAEARRANEILKAASGFFRSGARPPHDEMIRFIDEHRDQFGVEAICRTLRATECGFITSRGYRAAKTRPASARALRDVLLLEEVKRIHAENYSVYGVRKMHHAMRRAGWEIGRDQVARLMRATGLQGVRRGRKPITTRPAGEPDTRPDLVERRFAAEGPHRLWVADITYVRTISGFCYVAFITDVYSRRIVGWAVSGSLRTAGLPLLALEHALLSTGASRGRQGLIHHSDRGAQYVSLAYSDALITAGVTASVGTVGDSYDNALAETVNGLYKAELIHSKRIWESVQAVELATMGWVHWWNTTRLHEALDYRTPTEVETAYTHDQDSTPVAS
ncbi:IS3 family transposase [Micrococcus luteus]|uniref:IS3 family transposase n=1 Tax=Micrococcus luteus TaxID=1270 RepID=UPI0020CD5AFA|nr:IS3 family transposase [Micrococcus luteus]UTT45000.1 IS3 family transposase [Micrococcus luteus]UTT45008.1 IS3 family transposase [Micrococcus luteus]UTT45446.1 IS3 family transposase [Micrococcus luteus]UTT46252.1 IS3 family transposase [Micrococcus luteus]